MPPFTDTAGEAIGSRLEPKFIDEGLGTLDAETLDAMETLRDPERLLGIVTHVSRLAQRILADLLRMSSGLRFVSPNDRGFRFVQGYPDHLYIYTG